jgi:nucleosome binding factor SPN SPT16 subunit
MLAAGSACADIPGGVGDALGRHPPEESLLDSIKRLQVQQAAMKASKKDIQRQLKNATKRRQRLKKNARQLTDKDLVEVLQMRKETVPAVFDGEPTAAAALNDEVGDDVHMSE